MSNDKKMELVRLRAAGMNFARIEAELETSKPTLIKWARSLETEIRNAKAFEVDAIRSEFLDSKRETVTRIKSQLKRLEAEIEKRDLADVSTEKLFKLHEMLQGRLSSELAFCFEERTEFIDLRMPDNVETFRV